jgi:hypothetical protein
MSKPDVSVSSPAHQAKVSNTTIIEFTIGDKILEKNDAVIKIKNVSKFLEIDPTNYKITGHHEVKSHEGNISHHTLVFTLRDKKTKKLEQIVFEFLKQPNEKQYIGAVTSVTAASTKGSKLGSVKLGRGVTLRYEDPKPSQKIASDWMWGPFNGVLGWWYPHDSN